MINAKNEFAHVLMCNANKRLKCAEILYCPDRTDDTKNEQINLNIGYTELDFRVFLDLLNFEYDNLTTKQKLFGVIWFEKSNAWTERESSEMGENWTNKRKPKIPNFLKQVK